MIKTILVLSFIVNLLACLNFFILNTEKKALQSDLMDARTKVTQYKKACVKQFTCAGNLRSVTNCVKVY